MTKLQVDDRVVIKRRPGSHAHQTVMVVVVVDVPGHTPHPPSTYVVRLGKYPDKRPDFYLFGDAALERAPG